MAEARQTGLVIPVTYELPHHGRRSQDHWKEPT